MIEPIPVKNAKGIGIFAQADHMIFFFELVQAVEGGLVAENLIDDDDAAEFIDWVGYGFFDLWDEGFVDRLIGSEGFSAQGYAADHLQLGAGRLVDRRRSDFFISETRAVSQPMWAGDDERYGDED